MVQSPGTPTVNNSTIRPFCNDDAESLSDIFFRAVREGGSHHYSSEQIDAWAPTPSDPAEIRRRMSDGRICLVAEVERNVVCFGDLEMHGHIDWLYCLPEFQGQGVAGRVLDGLLRVAQMHSLALVTVEASEGAVRLFSSRGFSVSEKRHFELRGVELFNYRMEKRFIYRDEEV